MYQLFAQTRIKVVLIIREGADMSPVITYESPASATTALTMELASDSGAEGVALVFDQIPNEDKNLIRGVVETAFPAKFGRRPKEVRFDELDLQNGPAIGVYVVLGDAVETTKVLIKG